jgi:hypothetical protein
MQPRGGPRQPEKNEHEYLLLQISILMLRRQKAHKPGLTAALGVASASFMKRP